MKKKAFGIVLLVLAAWILLQGIWNSFGWQNMAFDWYRLFAYQSVEALLRRHLTSAVFTALVICDCRSFL